ncbi:hypothetical protein, partial [Bradyrhizobium sp. LeoA1S1]
MLIRPAIGDTDPIRYRRPNPDGQFSGNILDEAMRLRQVGVEQRERLLFDKIAPSQRTLVSEELLDLAAKKT